jgi:hypothetical protein
MDRFEEGCKQALAGIDAILAHLHQLKARGQVPGVRRKEGPQSPAQPYVDQLLGSGDRQDALNELTQRGLGRGR